MKNEELKTDMNPQSCVYLCDLENCIELPTKSLTHLNNMISTNSKFICSREFLSLTMDSPQMSIVMKKFVKSTETSSTIKNTNDDHSQTSSPKPKVARAAFVTGSQAKRFYESTVGEKAFKALPATKPKERKISDRTETRKIPGISKTPVNVNSLMKGVENGDINMVKQVLEENSESIDCKDQFGWTPLMSACCAGNVAMVKLLLLWKPNLKVRDKKGNSCLDLAKTNGHKDVADILNKYSQSIGKCSDAIQLPVDEDVKQKKIFFCNVCKQSVENTSLKKHLSSTVHNFHTSSKKKMPTLYGIPESNKGFQILIKSGWNKEEGLGPSGSGHKFPPKTILKQDKTGLGAKQYKARVTHTTEEARKEAKPKNTFKRQLRSDKIKTQRHEINLRRMLS